MKQLPNSYQAEQCVLAGMMMEPQALEKVLGILSPDGSELYNPVHREIFRGIMALHSNGNPVDVVTLADRFQGSDALKPVGGLSYLGELSETLPTTANIAYYARTVREKAQRREVIIRAQDLLEEAYEDTPTDELIETAQKAFTTIGVEHTKPYYTIKQIIKEGYEELERVYQKDGQITGVTTGFGTLDLILGGLQKTDLIIIAGRPSMGKSSLCCQVATNIAIDGKKVGYFSIEVGGRQVIKNILACQSMIETTKFRNGKFEDGEWGKINSTIGSLYETTFSIDDQSRTTQDVVRQARRMYAEHGLDILFIDHIQEMREKGRHESRNQEVDAIAGNLKALAKELNIPVVVVAQLSRKVEDRGGDFMPRLSDLRDSGSLEQKADVIMFVYREEYYKKENAEKPGVAKVIIAKHRNGSLGEVELKWHKEYVRFDELWRGSYT